jgi:hypothetical protein
MQDILTSQIRQIVSGRLIIESIPALTDNLRTIYQSLDSDEKKQYIKNMIETKLGCWEIWDNHNGNDEDVFERPSVAPPQTEVIPVKRPHRRTAPINT